MHPLVFRAALRASARVAFTAAIVGCGGATIANETGHRGPRSGAETPSDDAATGADVATNADPPEAGTEAGQEAGVESGLIQEAGPPGDSAIACNAPPPSTLFRADASANSVSESMFECCMAELTPLITTDSGTDSLAAAAHDPSVVACCGVVVFAVNQDSRSPDAGPDAAAEVAAFDTLGWGARSTCCTVLKWPGGGTTCEAWGPPTPPAMPSETDLPAFADREVA